MTATIKRGAARRPVPQKRRKPAKVSTIDRIIALLPVSEATLRRIATWTIMTMVGAAGLATASHFGVPGMVGRAIGERIGDAGFRVTNIQVTGLHRMDHNVIYRTVLQQKSKAMPLLDLAAIRAQLIAQGGWIEDAQVSRRLPDTLIVQVVERQPSAIWQKDGRLALIAANGTWLEPVDPEAMPDLPLVIGPHANERQSAYRQLLAVAPALGPQIKAATWVGNRRWTLTFVTGETLALPEGEAAAGRALTKFAQMDGVRPLLGRGWLGFDMRDPRRLIARKPAAAGDRVTSEVDSPDSDNSQVAPGAAMIEAKQSGNALQG